MSWRPQRGRDRGEVGEVCHAQRGTLLRVFRHQEDTPHTSGWVVACGAASLRLLVDQDALGIHVPDPCCQSLGTVDTTVGWVLSG